jgi:hypothetical protein
MPRGKKPAVKYEKASRSPGQRSAPRTSAAFKVAMKKPTGNISEIQKFIEENAGSGKSDMELRRHFQDEICKHERQRVEVSSGPSGRLLKCPDCGHMLKVPRR